MSDPSSTKTYLLDVAINNLGFLFAFEISPKLEESGLLNMGPLLDLYPSLVITDRENHYWPGVYEAMITSDYELTIFNERDWWGGLNELGLNSDLKYRMATRRSVPHLRGAEPLARCLRRCNYSCSPPAWG